ncbi:hypothetical protein [Tenacibaculum bernardetii]|uniref:hypothetical protein n=1 Tax=Tenacibaculum bernardetii TaxID=3021375 RepID=UPI0023AF2D98|nr:hypothetical protein [Tenacibaculum bernardetii]
MKKYFLVLLLSIVAIACQDEQGQDIIEKEKVLATKNNESKMLRFKTVKELRFFINDRLESDSDLLEEAKEMSSSGRYNPLLLVYNLESEEAERLGINEKEVANVSSDDNMLLFLLNEDGEIAIQGKIFRIDGEFVYTYTEGSSSIIADFLKEYNSGNIKLEKGKRMDYTKELNVYAHTNTNKNIKEELEARGVTVHGYFDSNHRMRARQFNGFWGFYSSIGANTLVQEKKKFLWWSWWKTVKTDNRLEYNMAFRSNVTPGYPGYPSSINVAKSGHKYCNCNQAQAVYSWSVGFPWAPEIYTPLEGESKHWAHWYSSNPNTVSITLQY